MSYRPQLEFENFSYNQIMLVGGHIGHSFKNSLFYTSWLVYSYTKDILIINLFKTLQGMRSGLSSILAAVSSYCPVWFVNLDQSYSVIVRYLAISCGEFPATSYWINGFISNYMSVLNTYRKLRKMVWFAYPAKNKNAIESYNLWTLTRNSWPRTIFLSNVNSSYQPAKETIFLGIPCLGLVDTNTYTHVVSIPIPSNDDSLECIGYYNQFISKYILLKKFFLIILWFYNLRKGKRLLTFKKWMKDQYKDKSSTLKDLKKKLKIKFKFDFFKNLNLGMKVLFSQNSKYNLQIYEGLDIRDFEKLDQPKNIQSSDDLIDSKIKIMQLFEKNISYLHDLNIYYRSKSLISTYKMLKYRFRDKRNLKLNLFTNDYFKTNIKIDRFYRTHLHWPYVKDSFPPKFFKFFIIYNFCKFRQLSTKIFNKEILNHLRFKWVIDQISTKGKFSNIISKGISYPKKLKFLSSKILKKHQILYKIFKFLTLKKSYNYSLKYRIKFFPRFKLARWYSSFCKKYSYSYLKIKDKVLNKKKSIFSILSKIFYSNISYPIEKFYFDNIKALKYLKKSFIFVLSLKGNNIYIKDFIYRQNKKMNFIYSKSLKKLLKNKFNLMKTEIKKLDKYSNFNNDIFRHYKYNWLKYHRKTFKRFPKIDFEYENQKINDNLRENILDNIITSENIKKKIISFFRQEKELFSLDWLLKKIEIYFFIFRKRIYNRFYKYHKMNLIKKQLNHPYKKRMKDILIESKNWRFFYQFNYDKLFNKKCKKNLISFDKFNLGWLKFKNVIFPKDWFYQKKIFNFPIWLFNYKKKSLGDNFINKLENKKVKLNDDLKEFKSILYSLPKLSSRKKHLLFNYAKINFNRGIDKEVKKAILNLITIELDKGISYSFRDKLFENLKTEFYYRRRWLVKCKLIARFKEAMDLKELYSFINKVLHDESCSWNKAKRVIRDKVAKVRSSNKKIYKYRKLIKIYLSLLIIHRRFDLLENLFNVKKIKLDREYDKFKNIYKYKLLNNYQINSNINNLILKLNYLPKLNYYKDIKNFLYNYKIGYIKRRPIFNKELKKQLKREGKIFNSFRIKKNFKSILNLKKFIKMYGFKWF